MKKSNALKSVKERIFEEYKKMKCDELEQKYNEAMAKMGLAHTAALDEVNTNYKINLFLNNF